MSVSQNTQNTQNTQTIPAFMKSIANFAKDNQISTKIFKQKTVARNKRAKEISKERKTASKILAKNQLYEQKQLKILEAVALKESAKQAKLDEKEAAKTEKLALKEAAKQAKLDEKLALKEAAKTEKLALKEAAKMSEQTDRKDLIRNICEQLGGEITI